VLTVEGDPCFSTAWSKITTDATTQQQTVPPRTSAMMRAARSWSCLEGGRWPTDSLPVAAAVAAAAAAEAAAAGEGDGCGSAALSSWISVRSAATWLACVRFTMWWWWRIRRRVVGMWGPVHQMPLEPGVQDSPPFNPTQTSTLAPTIATPSAAQKHTFGSGRRSNMVAKSASFSAICSTMASWLTFDAGAAVARARVDGRARCGAGERRSESGAEGRVCATLLAARACIVSTRDLVDRKRCCGDWQRAGWNELQRGRVQTSSSSVRHELINGDGEWIVLAMPPPPPRPVAASLLDSVCPSPPQPSLVQAPASWLA